jgi:hypothetical protein
MSFEKGSPTPRYRITVSADSRDFMLAEVSRLTSNAIYPDPVPLPGLEVTNVTRVSEDGRWPLDKRLYKVLGFCDQEFPLNLKRWNEIKAKFDSRPKKPKWDVAPQLHNPNQSNETQRAIVEKEHRNALCQKLKAGGITAHFLYSGLPVSLNFPFEALCVNDTKGQILLPLNAFRSFAASLRIEVIVQDEADIEIKTKDRMAASTQETAVLKKAALIKKFIPEWPTIEKDISDASRNGLNAAAKAPKHGDWFDADARKWAICKGKISNQDAAATPKIWKSHSTINRTK